MTQCAVQLIPFVFPQPTDVEFHPTFLKARHELALGSALASTDHLVGILEFEIWPKRATMEIEGQLTEQVTWEPHLAAALDTREPHQVADLARRGARVELHEAWLVAVLPDACAHLLLLCNLLRVFWYD